ncbi:MAG: hypothetical protein QY323_00915 [Patescibacteria group bacterium]|nr:MAG: hypothetical protein QY323_00915 [Patescibacteria group bacterium]
MRGGFRFNADESLDAGLQRFRRLHAEFLAAAIADAETHAEDRSDRWRNFVVFLEDSNASPQVWIEETVMGTREDALVVQDLFGGIATENPSVDEEVVPDRIVYSTSHESWAPYGGTAKLTQGVSYHTFYFNNLSAYGSTSTYEHEAQVYNRAYADYAGYWSSNLPYAYYDTPFSDSIDVFTVGSAQAASMATYTQYYTYMALSPGLATSATVRVKGQLGHRSPSWCYSTWCIFADATTGSMTTFLAPVEGISWSY